MDKDIIRLWLETISVEAGIARNTMAAYKSDIEEMAKYLAGKELVDAEKGDIQGFLRELTQKGLKSSSQARKLSALRQFYRFLMQEGVRKDDPTQIIEAPKMQRPLPKTLSQKEVEMLLGFAEK